MVSQAQALILHTYVICVLVRCQTLYASHAKYEMATVDAWLSLNEGLVQAHSSIHLEGLLA